MNDRIHDNANRVYYFFSFAYRYFTGKAYLSFTEKAEDMEECA